MSPRRLMFWILFAGTLLAGAHVAEAKCNLELQDLSSVQWRGATGAGYGAFDGSTLAQAVNFKVESEGSSCSFFVGVVSRSSRDPGRRVLSDDYDTLSYQIYRDNTLGTILRDTPEAASSEVLSGVISNKQTVAMQFYLSIPPLQIATPGEYEDTIEIRLYEGTVAQPILNDTKTISFKAKVPTVSELSFTGGSFDLASRSTTLRFDPARTGATGAVSLWARSNTRYILFAESQNGGQLENLDAAETDVIRYTMQVDGYTIPLFRGVPFPVGVRTNPTTASGWQHSFNFTLGTVDTQSAGEYRDVVTITLSTY
ncbi:MAG: spore coat protein U domain-containing protein [Gemmatimonas sp.]